MERDPKQFERTFREHHDAVLSYALRRAGSDADARDAVAETFLIAWRRFGEGRAMPSCRGSMASRGVLANQHRAAGRRTALVGRLTTETAAASQGAGARPGASDGALSAALARLTEADREALLLVAWEGLSTEEAARALGCRPATFRMRLHRARGRLAALLDAPAWRPATTPSMEPTP